MIRAAVLQAQLLELMHRSAALAARTRVLLHQQVMPLKYHFLACVSLIMVLPVQDYVLGIRDGRGVHAADTLSVSMLTLFLAPFLTALIACATVQADLDEKRCLFWQSKPVSVPAFMTLKYLVGLAVAMLVLGCPVAFMCLRDFLTQGHLPKQPMTGIFLIIALISLLTYSTCFFCNVLVRKTARAWLIGLSVACFVLLIPYLMPLPRQIAKMDVAQWISRIYLLVGLGTTVLAFGLSLLALRFHWHLRTNLRGLLWAGAGLIFMVAVLFGRQVANIKILDEVVLDVYSDRISAKTPGHYALGNHDVTVVDNRISVSDLDRDQGASGRAFLREPLRSMPSVREVDEDLGRRSFSHHIGLTYRIGEQEYSLGLSVYAQGEKVLNKNGREVTHNRYKKIRLSSSQTAGSFHRDISAIDLSDCIFEERNPYPTMRRIEDKLIVFLHNHCLVVSINRVGELELKEKNPYLRMVRFDHSDPFTIPLVPATGVRIRERVRLSLDLAARRKNSWNLRHVPNSSLVSDNDGKMRFARVTWDGLARYDVLGWDENAIRCQFRDARAFLFEQFSSHDGHFLLDGKLYLFSRNTLLVFDMLADRGIRKLGHLQRFSDSFCIEDIAVEENGNILLLSRQLQKYGAESRAYLSKSTLYLLKGP